MVIGTKYSAHPLKFLVQFKAKYLPQIAPEAVSEHEYVKKFSGGACPQTPLEVFGFLYLSRSATMQHPQTKLSRSTLANTPNNAHHRHTRMHAHTHKVVPEINIGRTGVSCGIMNSDKNTKVCFRVLRDYISYSVYHSKHGLSL